MRHTLTNLRTRFRDLTQNQDIANATIDRYLNVGMGETRMALGTSTVRETRTLHTQVDKSSYSKPVGMTKIATITVRSGSTDYPVSGVENPQEWIDIRSSTSSAERPTHYQELPYTFELWPTPSNADRLLTVVGEIHERPLANADYTTGNVVEIVNNAPTPHQATVKFTNATVDETFAGRWFKLDRDGYWYKIESVNTRAANPEIVLDQLFTGVLVDPADAPLAYTIGELPILPEELHEAPLHYAAFLYFEGDRRDSALASKHEAKWRDYVGFGQRRYTLRGTSPVIRRRSSRVIDTNAHPTLNE